jgi:hypothetical protein
MFFSPWFLQADKNQGLASGKAEKALKMWECFVKNRWNPPQIAYLRHNGGKHTCIRTRNSNCHIYYSTLTHEIGPFAKKLHPIPGQIPKAASL